MSCPVEQPLRCDLLKLNLSIRGICPRRRRANLSGPPPLPDGHHKGFARAADGRIFGPPLPARTEIWRGRPCVAGLTYQAVRTDAGMLENRKEGRGSGWPDLCRGERPKHGGRHWRESPPQSGPEYPTTESEAPSNRVSRGPRRASRCAVQNARNTAEAVGGESAPRSRGQSTPRTVSEVPIIGCPVGRGGRAGAPCRTPETRREESGRRPRL